MSQIKAKLLLLSVALVWGGSAFLSVDLPVVDVTLWGWHYYAIATVLRFLPNESLKSWGYHMWIATDQMVNAVHRGNCDITVSSKVGYMAEQGSKTAKGMAVVIDWMFYVAAGQKNHCQASIERDEVHH